MRYRCLKNDTVVITFSIWTSLAAPVWLTVRRTVCSQSGHHFHEHTPLIEHAIARWHCQWFPVGNGAALRSEFFSTVPRCESGSGRHAAGAHSKLDSQPGLSPGCWQPQWWCNEIRSIAKQEFHCFPGSMLWGIVLLKCQTLGSRNVTNSWKKSFSFR